MRIRTGQQKGAGQEATEFSRLERLLSFGCAFSLGSFVALGCVALPETSRHESGPLLEAVAPPPTATVQEPTQSAKLALEAETQTRQNLLERQIQNQSGGEATPDLVEDVLIQVALDNDMRLAKAAPPPAEAQHVLIPDCRLPRQAREEREPLRASHDTQNSFW